MLADLMFTAQDGPKLVFAIRSLCALCHQRNWVGRMWALRRIEARQEMVFYRNVMFCRSCCSSARAVCNLVSLGINGDERQM